MVWGEEFRGQGKREEKDFTQRGAEARRSQRRVQEKAGKHRLESVPLFRGGAFCGWGLGLVAWLGGGGH